MRTEKKSFEIFKIFMSSRQLVAPSTTLGSSLVAVLDILTFIFKSLRT